MLVTLREVLKDAQEKKYGVGLFNTVNLEMAKGVLAAAEELNSPVIIGTAEVLLPTAGLEELSYFLLPMARKASVPVVLHYDHGLTEPKIMEALRLGFSSIMYDCSTDAYENNVHRVARMVEIAHLFGATVEGELGHVGANEAGSGDEGIYTQPEQARDFVERTGVDALAVAIGTAALIAMGCHMCHSCHTGNCSWGICTQRPELTRRLNPEEARDRLVNLITGWTHEIKQ